MPKIKYICQRRICKGCGMSYSSFYLAVKIADKVASILGGTRDDYLIEVRE